MAKEEIQCTLTNEELIKECNTQLKKLCETGGSAFTMRVPIDRNKDTDMVFGELIHRFVRKDRGHDAQLKKAALPIFDVMARYLLPDEILGKFARLLELGAKMRNGGLETDEYEESENLFEEFRETYF